MSMIIPLKEINMIEVTSRELPEDMEKGIRDNWSTLLTRYPGMFNGPVFSTVKMENDVLYATVPSATLKNNIQQQK